MSILYAVGPPDLLLPGMLKRGGLPVAVGTLVSPTPQFPTPCPHLQVPAILSFSQVSWELQAFSDSKAEGNFLDETLAQLIGIP